jgi:hypothetical protein
MRVGTIMGLQDLGVPVGLIASLVAVFYSLGVFEVQDLTLASREPARVQSAPAVKVAALSPQAPAPLPSSAAMEAPASAETPPERRVDTQQQVAPPPAVATTASAEPAQAQPQYAVAAPVDNAQDQRQMDELLAQSQAAEESAQAQLAQSGDEPDPNEAIAEDGQTLEQFQATDLETQDQQQ